MDDTDAAERLVQAINRALDAGVDEDRLRRAALGARLWAVVNGKGLDERVDFIERALNAMVPL